MQHRSRVLFLLDEASKIRVEESEDLQKLFGRERPISPLDLTEPTLRSAKSLCELGLRPAAVETQTPHLASDGLAVAF